MEQWPSESRDQTRCPHRQALGAAHGRGDRPEPALAVEHPGEGLHHRRPRLHVRCLGCLPQRRAHPAAAGGMGAVRRPSGLDRDRQPHRHGPGRLRLGHGGGPDRPQEGLHRHPADVLALHPGRRPDRGHRLVRAVPLPGRLRSRRLHPRGLRPGGRVHPAQAAGHRAHRHGRLVAHRGRRLRLPLRLDGGPVGRLAAADAGDGPARPPGVLRAPARPGVPPIPDPAGPGEGGARRDRRDGAPHRGRGADLRDAARPGAEAADLRLDGPAARRTVAVLVAHHHGRVGPVLHPYARLLHRVAVAADVPDRGRV